MRMVCGPHDLANNLPVHTRTDEKVTASIQLGREITNEHQHEGDHRAAGPNRRAARRPSGSNLKKPKGGDGAFAIDPRCGTGASIKSYMNAIGSPPATEHRLHQTRVISFADINIVCGAHDVPLGLAGLTVAEICNAVADFLNTGPSLEAYVDGRRVLYSYVLRAGERLEFMKKDGDKGGHPRGKNQPSEPVGSLISLLQEYLPKYLQEFREFNSSFRRIADRPDSPARNRAVGKRNPISDEEANTRVRRYLNKHAGATIREVSEAVDVATGRISRLAEWQTEKARRRAAKTGRAKSHRPLTEKMLMCIGTNDDPAARLEAEEAVWQLLIEEATLEERAGLHALPEDKKNELIRLRADQYADVAQDRRERGGPSDDCS